MAPTLYPIPHLTRCEERLKNRGRPIPWMLEAAIVLEVVLGDYVGAGIIAVLPLFNAALGFFSEGARPGDARPP
jgi:hypothetical protein